MSDTYQNELRKNRYAQAVLAIKGKYTNEQLLTAAKALAKLEMNRPAPFGEQHLLQEAQRLLRQSA